ncbi:MAG: nucleotidyltransferase domain-containing protein [Desulfosudaceae bacterium]
MASKKTVLRDVKRYIDVLGKNGFPIQRAMLFGSWTRGAASDESDVDVALISNAFTGDRFQDRRKIVPLRRKINNRIEPIPFHPRNFEDGGILVDEILKYGEDIDQ